MIECREIVDSVKADISSASPSLNMDTSVTSGSEKQTEVKIVLDKDGNICKECTDLQVSNPEEEIVNSSNEVYNFRTSLPRTLGVCPPGGLD